MKENTRKVTLTVLGTFIVICVLMGASYAFISSVFDISNANVLYNTSFSDGAYNFAAAVNNTTNGDTLTLNLTTERLMMPSIIWSTVRAAAPVDKIDSEPVSFDISFTNGSNKTAICSFDYLWVWDSTSDQYTKTTDELVVSSSKFSTALPSYTTDSVVIGHDTISAGVGGTTTRTEDIYLQFINSSSVDQSSHANKTYQGRVAIGHVSCGDSERLVDFITYDAPRSGTDAVSNSSWILTSDHPGEWRYAGKNPDNYLSFNGELWRIIGVMPDTVYCRGTYGSTHECDTNTGQGSLVKIIRNSSLGLFSWDYKQSGVGTSYNSSGSNDWVDSQLNIMLNGYININMGFNVYGNILGNYMIYPDSRVVIDKNGYPFFKAQYSYLDGNGTTVYKPTAASKSGYTPTTATLPKKIEASSLSKIATVKWNLYGQSSLAGNNASGYYNSERNINNTGAINTNRSVIWYGKVALMNLSDYGYATNGGTTYSRAQCLADNVFNYYSHSDCGNNDYLKYYGVDGSAPTEGGSSQWTLNVRADQTTYCHNITNHGETPSVACSASSVIRPVLYLNADVLYSGSGTGTYNSPYTLK